MDSYEEAQLAWWETLRPGWRADGRRLRAMMPPERWSELDFAEKAEVAARWCKGLCQAWGVPSVRVEVCDFEEDEQRGAFVAEDWAVVISRRLFHDGAAVVAALAHELRHAVQTHLQQRGQHPLGSAGLERWAAAEAEYDPDHFLNQYENELEWDADEAEMYVRGGYCEG